MSTARYSLLIEPHQLAALAPGADVAIIDCRHELARPEWGAQAYRQAHLPGAVYAHLDRDLSSAVSAHSGRHPLPDPVRLAVKFGEWGIDRGTQIVAYDQGNGAMAARLWWLARWLGHERVAVLNGGLAAWQAAGLPLESSPARPTPRHFEAGTPLEQVMSAAEVQRSLTDPGFVLIDARAADRFAGRNETIDPIAGHVRGARNHPFTRNLDANGRFLPAAELAREWDDTLAVASAPATARIACMCGSGVTACHNLLALALAGRRGAALYAGSWSEWIRDPARPRATGTD